MTPPPVVILAGGASRRMGGRDKALVMLAGRPLLAHVIDRMAPQCEAMALNSNGDAADYAAFGLPVLPDTIPDRPGPLAGVMAAMDWAAAAGHAHVVTVTADTPFLPGDLVPQLLLRASAAPVLAESGGRLHPVVGLWPVDLRAALSEALLSGTRRVTDWTRAMGATALPFPDTDPDFFFNVNTPEDLARAETLLEGAR